MTPQQTIETLAQALMAVPADKILVRDKLRALLEDMKKQEPISRISPDEVASLYSNGIPLYTTPPLPQREGWQPIETAPTEWGSYLIWHPKYGMETLWWQLKDGGRDGRKAGHWYSEDDDGGDSEMDWRVTHWMPLPAAPNPTDYE